MSKKSTCLHQFPCDDLENTYVNELGQTVYVYSSFCYVCGKDLGKIEAKAN